MADLTDRENRRRLMAEEWRENMAEVRTVMRDPQLSRAEKISRLDELTGEGALQYAVMTGEVTGDDV